MRCIPYRSEKQKSLDGYRWILSRFGECSFNDQASHVVIGASERLLQWGTNVVYLRGYGKPEEITIRKVANGKHKIINLLLIGNGERDNLSKDIIHPDYVEIYKELYDK